MSTIEKINDIETPLVQTIDLSDVSTADDAMEKSRLVWSADSHEVMTQTGISLPDHKALIKSDNNMVLGLVGKDYNPTQLPTFFAQFDIIRQTLNLNYKSAMIYNGGKKVILKADFPKKILVNEGDECKGELCWGTSFDMSMANLGWFSILRLVCINGMTVSSKHKQFYCRHTKNSDIITQARMQILLKSQKYFSEFKSTAQRLSDKVADRATVNTFINEVFGKVKKGNGRRPIRKQNQIDEVKRLFRHGQGNNGETMWDLYNGYTEWVDHFRTSNKQKRLVSSVLGSGAIAKEKALKVALTLS